MRCLIGGGERKGPKAVRGIMGSGVRGCCLGFNVKFSSVMFGIFISLARTSNRSLFCGFVLVSHKN